MKQTFFGILLVTLVLVAAVTTNLSAQVSVGRGIYLSLTDFQNNKMIEVDKLSYDKKKEIFIAEINGVKKTYNASEIFGFLDTGGFLVRPYTGDDAPKVVARLTYMTDVCYWFFDYGTGTGAGLSFVSKTIDGPLYALNNSKNFQALENMPEFKAVAACAKTKSNNWYANVIVDCFKYDPKVKFGTDIVAETRRKKNADGTPVAAPAKGH